MRKERAPAETLIACEARNRGTHVPHRFTPTTEFCQAAGRLQRLLEAVQDRLPGRGPVSRGTTRRWERIVEAPGPRVPDWITIATAELEPGAYRMTVTVRDLATGGTVERTREFRVR